MHVPFHPRQNSASAIHLHSIIIVYWSSIIFPIYFIIHHNRPTMPVLTFELGRVKTRTKLAHSLNVNVRALDVVSLSGKTCRNTGCCLPSVVNNNDRCILCRQTWYPRNDSRGCDLYGSQFMARYCGKRARRVCLLPHGMMCISIYRDKCIEAITALGIDPKRRQQIADNLKKI